MNPDLNLPSGFHLVKIHLFKPLFDRLSSTNSSEKRSDQTVCTDQLNLSLEINQVQRNQGNICKETTENEAVLEMDVLPESTRFTLNVNSSMGLSAEEDEEILINNSQNVAIIDENSNFYEEVVIYVQKNSRLKLVLLAPCSIMDEISYEEIIRIVII